MLRDKPAELCAASAKATVPVLVLPEGVIDESLEIMKWALGRNDPEGWLEMPPLGHALISVCETKFKPALDHYKYANRYPNFDPRGERDRAAGFLHELNGRLSGQDWLFGSTPRLADMAILSFVRQFAFVDKEWFDAQPWPHLARWLADFIASPLFLSAMQKYTRWQAGDEVVVFPSERAL